MGKFCINCGAELPDTARFCPACGAAVPTTVPMPMPKPAPAPTSAAPAVTPKPEKKEWPFFAVLGLLLCVVVAAGGYYHFRTTNEIAAESELRAKANELRAKLVATWDAYSIKVGTDTYDAYTGEMCLKLHQNNTFSLSTDPPDPEPNVKTLISTLRGTWSCPDEETLVLDYDNGQSVKLSVKFVDGALRTGGYAEGEYILIYWEKA